MSRYEQLSAAVKTKKLKGIEKGIMKKNLIKRAIRKAANMVVEETTTLDTNVAEITPYTFRKISFPNKRLNLLVPSINPEHVFGGISTALKFFEELVSKTGYDSRIILVDAAPSEVAKAPYTDRYVFVEADQDSQEKRQILPYSNRFGKSMPVSDQDYFMFTGWWTAFCAQEAYRRFEKEYGIHPKPFINFIQDYEPGFYPWSTRYLLADATYKDEYPQIAVFNTGLLRDYFIQNGYHFPWMFSFEPVLNGTLKKHLDTLDGHATKKKQILIYGRPGTERNAFNLIIAILKKWVWMQEDVAQWEILSAGEQHDPVDLGNGKSVRSVGKLTLEEYAKILEESYAGISLMASPHPSYPPLEMASFGVKVITNTFANKDLKDFNENIISMNSISPDLVAQKLYELCNSYHSEVSLGKRNQKYCENPNPFSFIEEIKTILE